MIKVSVDMSRTLIHFKGIDELSLAYSILELIYDDKKYDIKISKNKFIINDTSKSEYPAFTKVIVLCLLFEGKAIFQISKSVSIVFYQKDGAIRAKVKGNVDKVFTEISKDLLDDVYSLLEQWFSIYRN